MINEKKLKIMTRVAIEEKNYHNEIEIAAKSFKVDYITLNMVYTAIATTIGYILIVALYVLGNLERLLTDVSSTDFPKLLSSLTKYYFMFLVAFLVIALLFYSIRYDKYLEKAKKELSDLKTISKLAEK